MLPLYLLGSLGRLPRMAPRIVRRSTFFGLQECTLLLALYSLLAIQMADFAADPGVGWHLASGEFILHNEHIPRVDPFLASPAPRAWVSDQWLSDVLLFALYAIGSWPLIYGVLAAVYLLAYFAALHGASIRANSGPVAATAATLFAFKLGQLHFILRPVVFGFACCALVLAAFWSSRDNQRDLSPPDSRRTIADTALPVVFLVWANLHPSFVLGLIFLALEPLGAVLDRLSTDRGNSSAPAIGRSFRRLVLCALATCVNPYGLALHRSIIALGTDPFFMSFHQEWLPPNPIEGVGLTLTLAAAVTAISFLTEQRPRSWGWFEVLVLFVFGALAFKMIRIIPFFALFIAVPLARSLSNHGLLLHPSRGPWGVLQRAWINVSQREANGAFGFPLTLLCAAWLVIDPFIRGKVGLYEGPFGPRPEKYPFAAVERLKDRASPETPVIVAAPPDWGGFITFYGRPFVRPVIDDRNTLLGADAYRALYRAFDAGGDLGAYLRSVGATHMLLPRDNPAAASLEQSGVYPVFARDDAGIAFAIESRP